eukprot:3312-Heterococcus_DN1.PRE.5
MDQHYRVCSVVISTSLASANKQSYCRLREWYTCHCEVHVTTHPVRLHVRSPPSEALHARGRLGACSACGIEQSKRRWENKLSIDAIASAVSNVWEYLTLTWAWHSFHTSLSNALGLYEQESEPGGAGMRFVLLVSCSCFELSFSIAYACDEARVTSRQAQGALRKRGFHKE